MTVNGSSGDDVLIGGDQADLIRGGGGKDAMTGGGGADIFYFVPGDSVSGAIDTVLDFTTGVDYLSIRHTKISIVRVADNGAVVFGSSAGALDTIIGVMGTLQASDIGSAATGIDMVGRDNAADLLIGGAGNDKLFGLSGSDTLSGGAGDDQLFGDAGADVLTGGAGADRFAYRGFGDSNAVDGYDIVTDFVGGTDKIDLTFLNGLQSVALVRSGDGPSCSPPPAAGRCRSASPEGCRRLT